MNNLRHATNSELLCEAFLHAFTGQPLPNDEDLRKERSDEIPEAAKALMRELGVDPDTGILRTVRRTPAAERKGAKGAFSSDDKKSYFLAPGTLKRLLKRSTRHR